jgi:hypothetical protein
MRNLPGFGRIVALVFSLSFVVMGQNTAEGGVGAKAQPSRSDVFEKTWFGSDSQLRCPTCIQSGQSLLISPDDGPGFLPFGPYEYLAKGKYEVEFFFDYIRPVDPDNRDVWMELDVGTWDDVQSRFQKEKFLSRDDILPKDGAERSSKKSFTLNFEVTEKTMVMRWEFRVFSYAKANYSLEKIVLRGR